MNSKTTSMVKEHLNWHLSRSNALQLILRGLLVGSSVTLSRIASTCGHFAENESLQKRFSRFFKWMRVDEVVWAKMILLFLSIPKKMPIELLIDRTNWDSGKTSINLLIVSIRWKESSVPLFIKVINEQKGGNCSFDQLKEVLEWVVKIFGKKRLSCIIGDREFGTLKRIALYQSLGIPFVMRVKEQWHYILKDSWGEKALLHTLFDDLKKNRTRTLHGLNIGIDGAVVCSVSAKRKSDGELIIILHSPEIKSPLKAYKRRWRIERMFLEFKSQGFQLESTKIKDPSRLRNLLMVIGLAFAMVIAEALKVALKVPIKIKKHKHPSKSLFKSGLELIRRSLTLLFKPFQEIVR